MKSLSIVLLFLFSFGQSLAQSKDVPTTSAWTKSFGVATKRWEATVRSTDPGGATLLVDAVAMNGAQMGFSQISEKLFFSIDLGAYIGKGGGKDNPRLDDKHFLKKDNFGLFTLDASYQYAPIEYVNFGPAITVEVPMDPGYIGNQALLGGVFLGAAFEGRFNHKSRVSFLTSVSRSFQIVSADKSQLTTVGYRIGLLYYF